MDKLKSNIGIVMLILGLVGSTGTFYSKFAKMELTINQLSSATAPDLSPIHKDIKSNSNVIAIQNTKIAVLDKTIKVLELEMKEFKLANKNPLR